jgi:hypothetical protein
VRIRGITTGIVVIAVLGLALAPTAGAGSSGPTATASGEDLVSYVTTGKLKLAKRLVYQFTCSANCSVTATATFVLRGPNYFPGSVTGSLGAGQVGGHELRPNKPLRRAIRRDLKPSKLRTEITATNLATGETDTDTRTFRFKRKSRA